MPIRLPADPQMLQATAGPGRQLWQTGPAPVIAGHSLLHVVQRDPGWLTSKNTSF